MLTFEDEDAYGGNDETLIVYNGSLPQRASNQRFGRNHRPSQIGQDKSANECV